jgi:hypothetical protein
MAEFPESKAWEKLANVWLNNTFAPHEVKYMMKNGDGKPQTVQYRVAKIQKRYG